MRKVATDLLEIAFEEGGPQDGPAVLLLHGWPDDIRAWRNISPALNAAGYRTVAPYLRGFGETRFLSRDSVRDGRAVALAQDALDLMDALGIGRFAVVGHDWGARTAYTLAAVAPERVRSVAALSVGFLPRGAFQVPSFDQSRRWWYQWFLTTDGGAEAIARDRVGFDKLHWDTWSPPGWYDEAEYRETSKSFLNDDWVPVSVHAYRSRWQDTECDDRYRALAARVAETDRLSTPTLLIQGAEDYCDPPGETEGQAAHFTGPYRRVLLEGVGHFPAREAPAAVARELLAHLGARQPAASVDSGRPAF
jgi:pimeloyl-ACP methyl ester carboxylesterase